MPPWWDPQKFRALIDIDDRIRMKAFWIFFLLNSVWAQYFPMAMASEQNFTPFLDILAEKSATKKATYISDKPMQQKRSRKMHTACTEVQNTEQWSQCYWLNSSRRTNIKILCIEHVIKSSFHQLWRQGIKSYKHECSSWVADVSV